MLQFSPQLFLFLRQNLSQDLSWRLRSSSSGSMQRGSLREYEGRGSLLVPGKPLTVALNRPVARAAESMC